MTDTLVSRLTEIVMAFPVLLFAIALASTIGPQLDNVTFGVVQPGLESGGDAAGTGERGAALPDEEAREAADSPQRWRPSNSISFATRNSMNS